MNWQRKRLDMRLERERPVQNFEKLEVSFKVDSDMDRKSEKKVICNRSDMILGYTVC